LSFMSLEDYSNRSEGEGGRKSLTLGVAERRGTSGEEFFPM